MKRKFGKALLAMTIGLSMVGCAKAPTQTNPGVKNPPTVVTPGGNNIVPGLGGTDGTGGIGGTGGDGGVCPPTNPPVVPMVAPLCNYIAFTSFLGGHFKLFLYDDILKDNYALPGAGEDINNPEYFDDDKIIFDRDGCILVYDMQAEAIVYLNDINSAGCYSGFGGGYLARPAASWDGKRVVFIDNVYGGRNRHDRLRGYGYNDRECEFFDGIAGRAYLWECGPCSSVCELAKINAIACAHGGVTWIDISADGRWVVFTTGDGQLYLYDILNPMVCLIADAMDIGPQCGWGRGSLVYLLQPSISATGKQIAFSAVTVDGDGFVRTSIWRYDRILGCLDPMPFANAALNANNLCLEFCDRDEETVYGATRDRDHRHNRIRGIGGVLLNPKFKCFDEETIYYEALVPGLCEGTVRGFEVLAYNWVTETVRTLSILNNVVATDVINLVSDLYGPYFCTDECDECGHGDHDGHNGNVPG